MSWTQVTEKDIAEALEGVDLTPAERLEAGQKNNTEVMASVTAPAKVEVIKKPIVKIGRAHV